MSTSVRRGARSVGALAPALPALIFLLAFFLMPLGFMVWMSLSDPEFGFDNYVKAFQSQATRNGFVNSLVICAQATVITAVLGSLVVVALIRWRGIARTLVLLSLLLPFVTSGELVRIVAWMIALSPDGFLSTALRGLGLVSPGEMLLPGRPAVLIGLVHILLPFFVLTCFTALKMLDSRLPQAAGSLGAPPVQAFLTTTVPLSAGPILGASLLVFMIALGYYATPAALGGTDVVLPTLITNQIQQLGDWGSAAALGTLLLVVTIVLFAIMLRFGGLSVLFSAVGSGASSAGGRFSRAWTAAATSSGMRSFASACAAIPFGGALLKTVHVLLVIGICVYLALPLIVAVPASFGEKSILTFPPSGFSLKWYEQFGANQAWVEALQTSLLVGLGTTVLSVLLAAGGAFVLTRSSTRGKAAVFLLLMMPLIMPWTVTAIGLYFEADLLGIAYQPLGLVIGHTVGGIPFALIVLTSAFASFDWRLDRAAVSLGASRLHRFLDIALPFLRPAFFGAMLFAFIWSFTEVVFAFLMNDAGTRTLPVAMWLELSYNISPIVAAAGGILTGSMLVLAAVYGLSQWFAKRRTPSG